VRFDRSARYWHRFRREQTLVRLEGGLGPHHRERRWCGLIEGVWTAKAKDGGAIRSDVLLFRAGHAPAFAVVVKLADWAERDTVEDEACVCLPGPLQEGVAPIDNALSEVLLGKLVVVKDPTRLRLSCQDGGMTCEAGALVEEAIAKKETLGVA